MRVAARWAYAGIVSRALAFVVENATSRTLQEACVGALVRKTEIPWHLVDCVQAATGAR